jgi:hypothetical protein
MIEQIDALIAGWQRQRDELIRLNESHPDAVAELFNLFDEEWTSYPRDEDGDCIEDEERVMEAFFNTFNFSVSEGELQAEFPYSHFIWDAGKSAWLDEDGEPASSGC